MPQRWAHAGLLPVSDHLAVRPRVRYRHLSAGPDLALMTALRNYAGAGCHAPDSVQHGEDDQAGSQHGGADPPSTHGYLGPAVRAGRLTPPDVMGWQQPGGTKVRLWVGKGMGDRVFVFFSNRLGCQGSLLVSVAVTILLIVLLRLV
jgi:hypothetical protein